MHLLLIGASNLVIKQGLVSYLESYLSKVAGIDSVTMDNLSIPSAMNMCGLSYLSRLDSTTNYDHIFVEFAVTDYPIFAHNPQLCQISFELLLLELQKLYPNCPKTVLLLGRREKKHHKLQIGIHKHMRESAAKHGFYTLDINALIKSFITPADADGELFRSLYLDGVHYRPPVVTNYIASVCALHIISKQKTPLQSVCKEVPNYRLQTFNFVKDVEGIGLIKPFESSYPQYNSIARQLTLSQELEFDVPGLPCGISFIATTDVASLMLEINGERSILHTLHRDNPPKGRIKFLVRHNPFFWMDYSNLNASIPQKSHIRLRPVQSSDPEWDEAIIRKSFGMVQTKPQNNSAHVCLLGLDYFVTDH